MKTYSKVVRFGKDKKKKERKIVEIPKNSRDNFEFGEMVEIVKVKE